MSNPPYHGQCLCGKVKYQVDTIEPGIGNCHCSMCRKFHGAAFATFGTAKKENFHWLEGESLLASFQADNQTVRRFCRVCGSSLTFADSDEESNKVVFALGTLDSDFDERPLGHIYLESKANWHEVADDLLKYKQDRGSEQLDKKI